MLDPFRPGLDLNKKRLALPPRSGVSHNVLHEIVRGVRLAATGAGDERNLTGLRYHGSDTQTEFLAQNEIALQKRFEWNGLHATPANKACDVSTIGWDLSYRPDGKRAIASISQIFTFSLIYYRKIVATIPTRVLLSR